ncbi:nitroreductase family protein [Candidatus Microthrix parvicella]|uniref:nitroreductase family protein n=1 Tax=Candidatus Neomicrothrix parvicella TaxID=41950 RepID=UPI00036D8E88|nr:nitroreductase family protein [Candidatus Microthrix parvicella]
MPGNLADGSLAVVMGRRRMCRDFSGEALKPDQLERLLNLARRAPSAGFTQGVAFVSLERFSDDRAGAGRADPRRADPVEAYWNLTLPPSRRASFAWPGLLDAPVLVTLWVRPEAWVERYGCDDKARAHLGDNQESWPVPYWWVDAGAVVQNLLLAAEAEGLGALFFGMFHHEPEVAERLGVPAGWRGVGTVALGHPAPDGRRPSTSARAGRPPLSDQWHRNTWATDT